MVRCAATYLPTAIATVLKEVRINLMSQIESIESEFFSIATFARGMQNYLNIAKEILCVQPLLDLCKNLDTEIHEGFTRKEFELLSKRFAELRETK